MQMIKICLFSLVLLGCSVPPLNLFKGSSAISQLLLPSADSGYTNLRTRVISSSQEYKAFLTGIDTQRDWEHKIEFGMMIAKAHIDFRTKNLLIYRHPSTRGTKRVRATITASSDNNATIQVEEESAVLPSRSAQAFFYKVSKKISKVTVRSKKRVLTIKNSTDHRAVVPKECVAWFDGCNHCIRGNKGRALCTKRYCKKKDSFRCIKWQ